MSAKKLCLSVVRSSNILSLATRNFSLSNIHYSLGSLTKDQAHDLVFRLNDEERTILVQTLEQFHFKHDKTNLESELASSRWRSRFGRPTKIDSLGDVSYGVYCKMPEDWLQKKIAAATPPPSSNDLMKLMIINSLPFVGFGFLDNFTMIIAGDLIEHSVGMIMTISTMAAAALGNTISDVLGIGSAVYIERLVEVIGIRAPKLSPVQLEMKSSRRASNFGRVFGITVGCLLGMLPLMFIKEKKESTPEEKEKDKKEEEKKK
ncbi:unnamed protein product [Diamesa tonsa]